MSVTDLIIIYLACGSPFGVYQITKSQPFRSASGLAVIFLSFLMWPTFAIALAAKHFFPSVNGNDAERHNLIDHIRAEIERVAFPNGETMTSVFEFREIFYRFSGLLEAANKTKVPARPSHEIFKIGGQRKNIVASRCLERRNRERLAYHQMRARNEFVHLLSRLADTELKRDEIMRLSSLLGDDMAAADMALMLSSRTEPVPPRTNAKAIDTLRSSTLSSTVR